MHFDTLALTLFAMGDITLLAYWRRRQGRREITHRMTESLRYAIRAANGVPFSY